MLTEANGAVDVWGKTDEEEEASKTKKKKCIDLY